MIIVLEPFKDNEKEKETFLKKFNILLEVELFHMNETFKRSY